MKVRLLLKTLCHRCCHCQRSQVLLNSNGKTKRKKERKKMLLSKKLFFSSRCETEFTSNKHLEISESDYNQRPGKYVDALGFLKTSNNMEIVIVEASR